MEIPADGQAQTFGQILGRVLILCRSKGGMVPAGSVGKVKRGGGIRERIFADENHIFRAGPFPATQAVVIQMGTDLYEEGSAFGFIYRPLKVYIQRGFGVGGSGPGSRKRRLRRGFRRRRRRGCRRG